jgi:hypothetical protein
MYRKSITAIRLQRKRDRAAKARSKRGTVDSAIRYGVDEKIGTIIGIGFNGAPFCVQVYASKRRVFMAGDAGVVSIAGVPLWKVVKAARKADRL